MARQTGKRKSARVRVSRSTEHLNLFAFLDENELPAAFVPLGFPIKTNAFAHKPIAERRDGIAIPLDGHHALSVQEGANLDQGIVGGIGWPQGQFVAVFDQFATLYDPRRLWLPATGNQQQS